MTDAAQWPIRPDPARDLILDTRTLQALTHPLRVRMLNSLRADGPSTSTRLAHQLGLNSGATSYHLRCLAAAGLIVEDGERGDGRDRWWQAAHRSTSYDLPDTSVATREMGAAYLTGVAATYADRVQRAIDEFPTLPAVWLGSWTLSDYRMRLTPAEHRQLLDELLEVVGRYRREDADASAAAPADAEHVVVQLQSFIMPGAPGSAAP